MLCGVEVKRASHVSFGCRNYQTKLISAEALRDEHAALTHSMVLPHAVGVKSRVFSHMRMSM